MTGRNARNHTFDGRLQLLEYVPTVLAGPPGVSSPADEATSDVLRKREEQW
jgi:hypothetical protein